MFSGRELRFSSTWEREAELHAVACPSPELFMEQLLTKHPWGSSYLEMGSSGLSLCHLVGMVASTLPTCQGAKALGWQMSFWISFPLAFATSMHLAVKLSFHSQSTMHLPSFVKCCSARIQTWSLSHLCLHASVAPYCLRISFSQSKTKKSHARSLWLLVTFWSQTTYWQHTSFLPSFLSPSTRRPPASQEISVLFTSIVALWNCTPWICGIH